jgi:uncharacterized Zn finger protein (UPF0148 family)
MAAACTMCGASLSFFRRLTGTLLCSGCEEKLKIQRSEDARIVREKHQTAIIDYQRLLDSIWKGETAIEAGGKRLTQIEGASSLTVREKDAIAAEAFRRFTDETLKNDILSVAEEDHLLAIGKLVGIDQNKLNTEFDDLLPRLVIARVNDGRLPVLSDPKILLKKNEVAHGSMNADLLKQVTVREYQGGYSGVSFRVMKGVRFHTGGVRGRSVVVGTEVKTDDTGVLTLTSHRAVFVGANRTVEVQYQKLIGMEVFSNGVKFNVSNRKNAILFQVESGEVVAALVNAAAQKLLA